MMIRPRRRRRARHHHLRAPRHRQALRSPPVRRRRRIRVPAVVARILPRRRHRRHLITVAESLDAADALILLRCPRDRAVGRHHEKAAPAAVRPVTAKNLHERMPKHHPAADANDPLVLLRGPGPVNKKKVHVCVTGI